MSFDFRGSYSSGQELPKKRVNKDPMTGREEPMSPSHPFASDGSGSGGFTGLPKRREDDGIPSYNGGATSPFRKPSIANRGVPRTVPSTRSSFSLPDIPWGILFMVLAVAGVVAFLYIYRDAITAFLTELLAWVIIIVVIVVVLRLLLFGGRR